MPSKTGIFTFSGAQHNKWGPNLDLTNAILSTINQPSLRILDLGCGFGWHFDNFRNNGYWICGVDGMSHSFPQERDRNVIQQDLTEEINWDDLLYWRLLKRNGRKAHWSLFIDVGEHIPSKYCDTLISNVASSAIFGIIVSWGTKSRGIGHVNSMPPSKVEELFYPYGWVTDDEKTLNARLLGGRFFRKRLLVFKKRTRW